MDDTAFDKALVTSALAIGGVEGWPQVTVPAAAQAAGLPLPRARERFRSRLSILRRFSRIVDQVALTGCVGEGSVRDRLFDLLMKRFDALQAHREGVLAILQALPCDPETALLLACETTNSMRWMLQAADVPTAGIGGRLRVRGLMLVWLYALRAWQQDASADLSATMAAVDTALDRAEAAASWLHRPGRRVPAEDAVPPAEDTGGEAVAPESPA